MTNGMRSNADDLRAAGRLAVEATRGVTDLVEAMHVGIGGGPSLLGRPFTGIIRLFSGPVYATVRGVTRLVGGGLDAALAQLAPLLGENTPGPERVAVQAALNGVLGDYLQLSGNPLAIEMSLTKEGEPLSLDHASLSAAFPSPGGRLLVLVHGSCASDRQWRRRGHDHGAALARDLGYVPLFLRYNSGLHISTNGRALAELLDRLVAAWPVPVEELELVTHSMGGLVARSACHVAEDAALPWRGRLRRLVFLGTPHHGAPLEQGGQWVQALLGIHRYTAPLARLGKIRSAGVTDLRYGSILDEDWQGRDRFALHGDTRSSLKLPEGVECFAIAATKASAPRERLPSDGLVPVDSALGRHRKAPLTLAFPDGHTWIAYGANHLDLLSDAQVYAKIRSWLEG